MRISITSELTQQLSPALIIWNMIFTSAIVQGLIKF